VRLGGWKNFADHKHRSSTIIVFLGDGTIGPKRGMRREEEKEERGGERRREEERGEERRRILESTIAVFFGNSTA
jgi:hypothetical protein